MNIQTWTFCKPGMEARAPCTEARMEGVEGEGAGGGLGLDAVYEGGVDSLSSNAEPELVAPGTGLSADGVPMTDTSIQNIYLILDVVIIYYYTI